MKTTFKARITKKEFYRLGGLSNSSLFRKGTKSGWTYWMTFTP